MVGSEEGLVFKESKADDCFDRQCYKMGGIINGSMSERSGAEQSRAEKINMRTSC
jgi:hypothetical protein